MAHGSRSLSLIMDAFIQAMFDESVLESAAARYGVPNGALRLLGGFQSYIYEFEHQGQARILRISHTAHRSIAQVHGEAAWINYLVDRGIPAARVVPAPDGALVQMLPAREGAFIAAAFERAPGTRVSHDALGPALYRQMGILMGRMHVLTQDYVPPTLAYRRPTWHDQAAGFAARCLPDSEQVAIDKFDAELAYLQTLPTERESYGLAHTDVHLGNIHIHDGQLTLFDFDDCQYTWFVDDIAIALFYATLSAKNDQERLALAQSFLPPFLEGYYQAHWLAPKWFAQIPHFLKVREIGVYAAIHAHCGGNIDALDPFGQQYVKEHKPRIENDVPCMELDFESVARSYAIRPKS